MITLEIALRFFKSSSKSQMKVTSRLSLVGFILGVASLVVAMGVVNGFEQTLFESLSRINGHLQIRKSFTDQEDYSKFKEVINSQYPRVTGITPVLWVEALAISKGSTQGVLLQGLDFTTLREVLSIDQELPPGKILIGAGLARKWQIASGDRLSIVVPIADELNPQRLRRSHRAFEVAGILHLGKHEYDERIVILHLDELQALASVGEAFSGALMMTEDRGWARQVKNHMQANLGLGYRVQTWYDINSYLFEAIQIEKIAIFLIILIIVVASSFNVGVALWIGVLQRTREVSILKTLGMRPRQVIWIMSIQGLLLALVGAGIGIPLGVGLSYGVDWVQTQFTLLPGSVYEIDQLRTQIRFQDIMIILGTSVLLAWAAVLWPARNAASREITEGLRYE